MENIIYGQYADDLSFTYLTFGSHLTEVVGTIGALVEESII